MSHKEVPPYTGEGYGAHWGFTSYNGKVVLDVGADYGSTASFFFQAGASKVIAVEANDELYEKLVQNYGNDPDVICIHLRVSTPEDFLRLLQHQIDIAKIDCEECEQYLLQVPSSIVRKVKEYLVETHTEELHQRFIQFFESLGYKWEVVGQPRIIHAMIKEDK